MLLNVLDSFCIMMKKYIGNALSISRSNTAIIEEFIQGKEVVQLLISNENVYVIEFSARIRHDLL